MRVHEADRAKVRDAPKAEATRRKRKAAAEPLFTSRVPGLDGLRGIALVAVLGYHAAPEVVKGGFLGVEMFFVLSGFLLTALLLDEHDRTGAIDRLAYARRRLRRILPALLVLLAALPIVGRVFAPDDVHRLAGDILTSLGGIVNWHLIDDGGSYFAQTGRPPLVRHLWSIAVELQAYVVIPFVAAFVARRNRHRAVALLALGVGASAGLMAVLYDSPDPSRAYYGTDTRIGALLAGAIVAVMFARRREARGPVLTDRAITLLGAAASVCLLALFALGGQTSRLMYPAGFLLVQAATIALIYAAVSPGPLERVMTQPRLRWLGTRSYGIYLWHWPIVVLIRPGIDVTWPHAVTAGVGIAAALALGALSYRFVERPFLSESGWATRPLPRATWAVGAAWVAATMVLVATLGGPAAVDPIEQSLLAGEAAMAEQEVATPATSAKQPSVKAATPSTKRAAPAPQPRSAPAPAVKPGKLPTRKGPAPGTVKLSAVGDSVMLGATPHLRARLGKTAYINAEKNRHVGEGVEAVRWLRAKKMLGRVLVVHLGNNGPARREELDAIMHETKSVSHVLFMTVRVTKPWQDSVNAELRAADKRHKKIKIVDWFGVSKGHPDWFYSDGTHVNRQGAEAYTKLVASSVPPPPKPKPKPQPKPTPKPTPTPALLPGLPAE